MTYKICYWDDVEKVQKERNSTTAEDTQRAADLALAALPVVPKQVTRSQALQALFLAGKTSSDIETAISAALPSPQKELALIEFKESLHFERARPLVNNLGPLLGLSSTDIDNLFITAATL